METLFDFTFKKDLRVAVARGDVIPLKTIPCTEIERFRGFKRWVTFVDGPHGAHKWMAEVLIENNGVVKVKS